MKAEGKAPISEQLWAAVSPNLTKVDDVNDWVKICGEDLIFDLNDEDRAFTRQAAELLPSGEFDENTFGTWTAAVKEKTGRKGRDLFHPIRLALTGLEQGPELKMLLPVLGYEKTLKRLQG